MAGDSVYDKFRQALTRAQDGTPLNAPQAAPKEPAEALVQQAGGEYDAFRNAAKGVGDAVLPGDNFARFKGEHPYVAWGADQIGPMAARTLGGEIGAQAYSRLNPATIQPGQPSSPADGAGLVQPPASLPQASPPLGGQMQNVNFAADPRLSIQTGSSTPAPDYEGAGTDQGVRESQKRGLSIGRDMVQSKTDEASGAMGAFVQQGQNMHDFAQAQALSAYAVKQAADDVDREQVESETHFQKAVDDSASRGVDPGRSFKNRDVGFWLIAGIGAIASGMLSAVNGQAGNPFMDAMRQMVNADIGAQETDIAQGWKKANAQQTAYMNARARGADKVTATIRQWDQVLTATKMDLEAKLQQAKTPEEQARLQAGVQAVGMEMEANQTKYQQYWQQKKESRAAAAAAAATAAAKTTWEHAMQMRELGLKTRALDIEQYKAGEGAKQGHAGADKDFNDRFVATGNDPQTGAITGGLARDAEEAKKLSEARLSYENAMSTLDAIERLRGSGPKEEGKNTPAGGMIGRAGSKLMVTTLPWERGVRSEAAKLIAAVNHSEKLGAFDAGSAKLLTDQVGSGDTLASVGTAGDQMIAQTREQIRREYENTIRVAAMRPAIRAATKDGRTGPVETGATDVDVNTKGVAGQPGSRALQ